MDMLVGNIGTPSLHFPVSLQLPVFPDRAYTSGVPIFVTTTQATLSDYLTLVVNGAYACGPVDLYIFTY